MARYSDYSHLLIKTGKPRPSPRGTNQGRDGVDRRAVDTHTLATQVDALSRDVWDEKEWRDE